MGDLRLDSSSTGSRRLVLSCVIAAYLGLAACTAPPTAAHSSGQPSVELDRSRPTAPLADPEAFPVARVCDADVTTDASSYTVEQAITVTWDCLPGNSTDWIVLLRNGLGCSTSNGPYIYTGGATSGSYAFPGTLPVGQYYARAYSNGTCTQLDASPAFDVVAGTPTIAVDAASYGETDAITVTWHQMPGYTTDHMAISRSGTSATYYVASTSTGGAVTGSMQFDVSRVGAGTFTARAYLGASTTVLAETSTFTVDYPAPTLSVGASSYPFGDAITVMWDGLNDAPTTALAIAPPSPLSIYDYYVYSISGGAHSGSHTFTGYLMPPGPLQVRALENSTNGVLVTTVVAEGAPFEVTGPGGPWVDVPELVSPSTAFDVQYDGLTGFYNDVVYVTTYGNAYYGHLLQAPAPNHSGTVSFSTGLASPGRYEARGLDTYLVLHLVASDEFIVPSSSCLGTNGLPLPDGTSCAAGNECFEGLCSGIGSTCGNGVRRTTSPREGCDDGYTNDGDACSATCTPTAMVVAGRDGMEDRASAGVPTMAIDGTGRVLFAWLAERLVAGDPVHDLVARRYSSAGVALDASPFVLEADVGPPSHTRASLTGMADGWAVTWRSPRIEGAVASEGGIALSVVPREPGAAPSSPRRVNETTLYDQLDPSVAFLDGSLVVVWVDRNDGVSGHLRMRTSDTSGRPTGHELAVATDEWGDQSEPFVLARADAASPDTTWAVAWTTQDAALGELPEVRLRRFDGTTALDAADVHGSHEWGSSPSLASTSGGLWLAWTSRSIDSRGDIVVRYIGDASTPTDDSDVIVHVGTSATEDHASIAAFPLGGSSGYVIAYDTNATIRGARFEAGGAVTLPPEGADLSALLESGQSRVTLVPSVRGLWASWSDPTIHTTATSALVGYLLPWN